VGNPLTSEVAAFRWMVAVLVAAASVALVAKLFGSTAGIFYGMFLLLVLAGFIVKGMIYMLGSPDDDEEEDDVVTELRNDDYNE